MRDRLPKRRRMRGHGMPCPYIRSLLLGGSFAHRNGFGRFRLRIYFRGVSTTVFRSRMTDGVGCSPSAITEQLKKICTPRFVNQFRIAAKTAQQAFDVRGVGAKVLGDNFR